MKEEVKDIDGYNGDYQITNTGRVISTKFGKTRVLKPGKNIHGQFHVVLCKDSAEKTVCVHRLVISHFKPEIANHWCILHKDGNKENNSVDNLVACGSADPIVLTSTQANMNGPVRARGVTVYDPVDDITYNIHSMYRASKILKCSLATIYNVCNGRQKSVKGLIVKYATES